MCNTVCMCDVSGQRTYRDTQLDCGKMQLWLNHPCMIQQLSVTQDRGGGGRWEGGEEDWEGRRRGYDESEKERRKVMTDGWQSERKSKSKKRWRKMKLSVNIKGHRVTSLCLHMYVHMDLCLCQHRPTIYAHAAVLQTQTSTQFSYWTHTCSDTFCKDIHW